MHVWREKFMEADYIEIGKRIKRLRKERKMSQEALASRIDVSIPHMSNIENGKTKFSLPVLLSLTNALGVTPDALLVGAGSGEEPKEKVLKQIAAQLEDCTEAQMQLLAEAFRGSKKLLQQYDEKVEKK